MKPGPSVSATIARFAVRGDIGDAANARRIACLSLLDWLAVGLAARGEPVSVIVRQLLAEEGGSRQATAFGHPVKIPMRAAALVNGTTSHALDYDDTHFLHIGHPSVAVMPAALAVAEGTGKGFAAFLDAALVGLEIACRLGHWLGRSHYQHGFHQTATSGCFGAAMAAARLLGADVAQAENALGLAATRASGLKCQFGSMGKPYHAGMAAANGVEVAKLAVLGFIARADALECEQGFAATHAATHATDSARAGGALQGLGETFVFESVQHKFHACCHGTHAALEALAQVRDEHALPAAEIQAIEITVHPRFLTACNIQNPTTGLEAKFSYRLTAALVILGYDTSAIATFTDERCTDPELVSLRDRVLVATDERMNETEASVRITRHSAPPIETHHDLNTPRDYPTRERKVRAKAATLLEHGLAARLWEVMEDGMAGDVHGKALASLLAMTR